MELASGSRNRGTGTYAPLYGRHPVRRSARPTITFPPASQMILVWEFDQIPDDLFIELAFHWPVKDRIERVALLPQGMERPDSFSFIDPYASEFARDGLALIRLRDGGRLLISGLVSGSEPDSDEIEEYWPVLDRTLIWNPGPRDLRRAIRVWRQCDTPNELIDLVSYGGDEDWVAHVPAAGGKDPAWLEEGGRFGCCSVHVSESPDGGHLHTGCHA